MLAHDALTTTQAMLMHTRCPNCLERGLEVRLRCAVGDSCRYHALCTHCRLEMEVNGSALPDVLEGILLNLVCPHCGARKAQYSFECSIRSVSCRPVVRCGDCEYVFASWA